ncbi:MAG: SufD family Fe-S cluster assembly protein [Fibrobacteria bacterium]
MTQAALLNQPRFMREEPQPAITPAQAAAIPRWIEAGPPALADIRSAAFGALRKTGLPHKGSEDFTFIRVGEFLPHLGPPAETRPEPSETPQPLAKNAARLPTLEELESQLVAEAKDAYLVLVDGVYHAGLSKFGSDFQVSTLSEGKLGAEARATLEHIAAEETDAVAALGMIFSRDPLVIQVAAKTVPAGPLLVLHFHTGSGTRSDALVVCYAGKHSQSEILVRHSTLGDSVTSAQAVATGSLENVHTVALLDEGSSLRFLEAGAFGDESLNRDLHFRKFTARLQRDSRLVAVSAHTGSRLTRNSFAVDLAGEGAEAEINGAVVLIGGRQSHNFVRLRHLVPHCVSRQLFKSVAADQSRSSVDGAIYVAKHAQQTNAYQIINNLMLSDEARADSKPQLMIHADDVKCSHGSTSGKLDPAQQFYLESRGLPPMQARALLTVAFIAEVLGKADKAGFRAVLDHALLDTLKDRLPAAAKGA